MDYARDDDRMIVVAMVDFAISAQFGLIYCKKLLAMNPINNEINNCCNVNKEKY